MPCFAGATPVTGLAYTLDSGLLSESTTVVQVTLHVTENGRTDEALVTVEIVAAPVPDVLVLDLKPKYSASQRISLVGFGAQTFYVCGFNHI